MKRIKRKLSLLAIAAMVFLLPVSGRADWLSMGKQEQVEEDVQMIDGIELEKSYKKDGENNPLYTQRFGADPGVMEYNGRIYVYMTNDIIEYESTGRVKENSYSKIRPLMEAPLINMHNGSNL